MSESTRSSTLKKKPLFVAKPNMGNAMIPRLSRALVQAIILTVVLFLPLGYFILISNWGLSIASLVIVLVVLFLLSWAIDPLIFYMNLRAREYRFFVDRLEYYEGWLTIVRHTVPYKKVTDIKLRKNVWDRMFNTATIGLLTPASYAGSIYISYVGNPEKVYDYLRKIILNYSN